MNDGWKGEEEDAVVNEEERKREIGSGDRR